MLLQQSGVERLLKSLSYFMQKLLLYHQVPSGESKATKKQPLVGKW